MRLQIETRSKSASVIFTVSVEDEGSRSEGGQIIAYGFPQEMMKKSRDVYTNFLSEGEHTWSIEAVDDVGNMANRSYSRLLSVRRLQPSGRTFLLQCNNYDLSFSA
ncbi:MAG: hypothetical protein JTT15_06560 [Candidatus Brockarchaeota archaeon]|nr:hypothetical protein [Candidatus Brockarchaeota archaeon]